MFHPAILLASLCIAGAFATTGFVIRPYFTELLDWVEQDLSDKLRRLRVKVPELRVYLLVWMTVIATASAMLWVSFGGAALPILAILIMSLVPWYFIHRMAQKYREAIEDQLADGMASFSSAIKAGLSLAQALELLADEGPKPMCDEFRQIVGEYHMGKPLDRTLEEAKERLRSENFALFAAALLAARESGGKLNETVDRIATSVLEMRRLDRKIRAETAQARKAAVYMALAPFFFLVGFYFLDPINVSRLFYTLPGNLLLCMAVLLNIAAFFWARKILNPDI